MNHEVAFNEKCWLFFSKIITAEIVGKVLDNAFNFQRLSIELIDFVT
ncbi:hypothetical protein [Bacillus cereus]